MPTRVGGYPVLRELGRGGMGIVYEAMDPALERRVALKLLPEGWESDHARVSRFRKEAKLLAAINHPNIATIYSLEESAGASFLTMELIQGAALDQRILSGTMDVPERLKLCHQVATALEAAHSRGIVHRDLSPRNIMVTSEGFAKVLDFGLAQAVGPRRQEARPHENTTVRGVAGTPGYISPELLRGEDVDPKADVWSFGCILFECLSGQRAFGGESVSEKLHSTLNEEPHWSLLPEGTAADVLILIRACLEKDAEQRVGSMARVRQQLEELIAALSVPTSTEEVSRERGNLPYLLSSFVGREEEVREVHGALEHNRLVTLLGTGGCGKTRLAIESASKFEPLPDGVWLVELAAVSEPDQVLVAACTVFDLKEEGARSLLETLTAHLSEKSLLIVLDNCEHVLEAAAQLANSILRACPGARVLVTSREAMGVGGEHILLVKPLPVPGAGDHSLERLASSEAVQLFVERARTASKEFELVPDAAVHVADICRRLDGIPLALELAAARLRSIPLEDLARRLGDRFQILTAGDATEIAHHRTLRALFDWSYEQLTERERMVFRRLSVHTGGWALDSAEAVSAGAGVEAWEVFDLQTRLVEKSLAEIDVERGRGTGRTRYRMLETVRQYAREKLCSEDEEAAVLGRFVDFYLNLATETSCLIEGAGQQQALRRLETEAGNLRGAALADETAEGVEKGLRLFGALWRFWFLRGHWSEARALAAELLSRRGTGTPSEARTAALIAAANLAGAQGDYHEARRMFEECLAVYREREDGRGLSVTLNNLGVLTYYMGDFPASRRFQEESLAIRRNLDDRFGLAASLNNLGLLMCEQGEYERARTHFEEALAIVRVLEDQAAISISLYGLGYAALLEHRLDDAHRLLAESLKLRREVGDREGIGESVVGLGMEAFERGDRTAAREFFEDGLAAARELEDRFGVSRALHHLGLVALGDGAASEAESYFREGLSVAREARSLRRVPDFLEGFAALGDDATRAVCLIAAAESTRSATTAVSPRSRSRELSSRIARLKEELPGDSFAAHWSRGQNMTPEEAIDYALKLA